MMIVADEKKQRKVFVRCEYKWRKKKRKGQLIWLIGAVHCIIGIDGL